PKLRAREPGRGSMAIGSCPRRRTPREGGGEAEQAPVALDRHPWPEREDLDEAEERAAARAIRRSPKSSAPGATRMSASAARKERAYLHQRGQVIGQVLEKGRPVPAKRCPSRIVVALSERSQGGQASRNFRPPGA